MILVDDFRNFGGFYSGGRAVGRCRAGRIRRRGGLGLSGMAARKGGWSLGWQANADGAVLVHGLTVVGTIGEKGKKNLRR